MRNSKHYELDRQKRAKAIEAIGEGTIIHSEVQFDEKRQRYFRYEITSTAMLIVRATDDENLIITKIIARPSRIKLHWADAPENIIKLAIEHARQGYVF